MKFNKWSQLALVSLLGLGTATLLTSCAIVTIDYVFVANASGTGGTGVIQTFDADSQSGALRSGAADVASGGVNPVAMAASADYKNLYVVNQGSSNVAHFTISASGIIAQKDVVTTSTNPTAVAVNTAQTYLYVVSGPNPTVLTAYSLSSGTIGSVAAQVTLSLPGDFAADTIVPTGVNVLANGGAVFVSAYDQSAYNPGGTTTSDANPGWIFGFASSGGALTASTNSPYKAGVKPSAITSDPTNRFVYVTDFASNQLVGYSVQDSTTLAFLTNGPFKTGNEPASINIDPRGKYMYVANALDSTVSAYVIDLTTGTPSGAVNPTGSQTNTTDTTPVSVIVDPALGRFVYTANQVGNTVSGFRLNPDTGALTATQAAPYPVGNHPTALASVPHGNHSIQTVSP